MRKIIRNFAWIAAIIMALGLFGCQSTVQYNLLSENSQGLTVHFIDVGQADCALLQCDGQTMLIDGGNVDDSARVVAYLRKAGITQLDYVICTHGHEDHVGGLAGVLAAFDAERVLSSCMDYDSTAFQNFKKYAARQGKELEMPLAGDEWSLGEAAVTVLGPIYEYEEENDNSVVLRVDYGRNSFLFTGDAEALAEKDVVESNARLDATVLKVGHHGSSTSTSYRFLDSVMPKFAVISVGEDNSYGHPHDEVMSRLRDADVEVYRTDMLGDIVVHSDGETVTFENDNSDMVQEIPENAAKTEYIGNKNSKVFHLPSCEGLPAEKNSATLSGRQTAIDLGYKPCGRCKP